MTGRWNCRSCTTMRRLATTFQCSRTDTSRLGRRYPETSVGWYRREFDVPASDLGRRISVEFDGVFRSVLVFVNGCFIGRNDNGYAPFHFDLTDFLAYGAKNYIVVRVDASFGDGWFYEGAGIYRHVWLTKTDALHMGKWEAQCERSQGRRRDTVARDRTVVNEGKQAENARVSWKILDGSGKTVATSRSAGSVHRRRWHRRRIPQPRSSPIPPSGRSMRPISTPRS